MSQHASERAVAHVTAVTPTSRVLTEENLSRAVWQLAWPAVLTMLLQFLNGLVDMFFVGSLGPAAQAAVRMGGHVGNLAISIIQGVLIAAWFRLGRGKSVDV